MDPSLLNPDLFHQLQTLLSDIRSLKQIGTHKHLAKFGDSVTNLVYSFAKTALVKQFTQRKVNRTILSHALKNAEMKEFAKTRSDAHALADTTEAFIGFMYCMEGWTIEYMASILVEKLQHFDLLNFKEETQGAIESFTYLLSLIKTYLEKKWEISE